MDQARADLSFAISGCGPSCCPYSPIDVARRWIVRGFTSTNLDSLPLSGRKAVPLPRLAAHGRHKISEQIIDSLRGEPPHTVLA